jgi:elongation factor G
MANGNYKRPWLIEVPVEPKSKDDRERLAATLAKLAVEDPAFGFAMNPQSGQILLLGMAELHLDIKIGILRHDVKVDILRRPHKIEFNAGAPRVAYREKITRAATVEYVYKGQNGGPGQFARVKIICEPLQSDGGFRFESRVAGDAMPREYLAAVEKGLESALGSGVVAACPVVDLKVTLIDCTFHESDSSALAFELAARAALREALQKGAPAVLEPIMSVEVVTPDDFTCRVVGDLKARRGQILRQDICGNANIIGAMVPLANMFGYVKILRSISEGRATSVMQFDHYAPVPFSEDDLPFRLTMGVRTWPPLIPALTETQSPQTFA